MNLQHDRLEAFKTIARETGALHGAEAVERARLTAWAEWQSNREQIRGQMLLVNPLLVPPAGLPLEEGPVRKLVALFDLDEALHDEHAAYAGEVARLRELAAQEVSGG
jgi:hypothetical protein